MTEVESVCKYSIRDGTDQTSFTTFQLLVHVEFKRVNLREYTWHVPCFS